MDQLFKERVKDLIKELRGERSQTIFAELLGLSQSAISDYEKGRRIPDNEAIEKIAEYCGLLPEQLIAKFYGRVYIAPCGEIITPTVPQLSIDEQIRQMGMIEKVRLLSVLATAIKKDIHGE